MNNPQSTSASADTISSTSTTLRLFFALELSTIHSDLIAAWCLINIPHTTGRLVKPENFHITLAFLGACPSEQLPAISRVAARIQAPAFDMPFGQLEYFAKSRVLCLAPRQVPTELLQLVEQLQAELKLLEFDFKQRYRPHITLVRKARFKPECAEDMDFVMHGREFCLYQSITDHSGVRYTKLNTWSLSQI